MSVPAETRRTFSKGEAPPALGRRGWGPVVLVGLEPEEASSLAQALGKAGLPVEVASPGSLAPRGERRAGRLPGSAQGGGVVGGG